MSRPERFAIEFPDGGVMELDEETTELLYAEADREGVDPATMLRATIRTQHLLMTRGLLKKE